MQILRMQNFRRSTTTDGWWQWSNGLAPPPLEVRRQFNKFVEIRNGGGEIREELVAQSSDLRASMDSRRPSLSEQTDENIGDLIYTSRGVTRDNLRAPAARGVTPLRWAARQGYLPLIKWLKDNGAAADISRPCANGCSPFLVACAEGHLDVARWLYENGASKDVRKADLEGNTPFLWACLNGHLHIVKWLYENGAAEDIRIANKTKPQLQPLSAAVKLSGLDETQSPSDDELCRFLILRGALCPASVDEEPIEDLIPEAARRNFLEWIEAVIQQNQFFMNTVILAACCERSLSTLSRLKGNEGILVLIGEFTGIEKKECLIHAQILENYLKKKVMETNCDDDDDDDKAILNCGATPSKPCEINNEAAITGKDDDNEDAGKYKKAITERLNCGLEIGLTNDDDKDEARNEIEALALGEEPQDLSPIKFSVGEARKHNIKKRHGGGGDFAAARGEFSEIFDFDWLFCACAPAPAD